MPKISETILKIGVLGAGVIGVTTAYALARQGHEVSVIDKGPGVATGSSHANGAQLSYSYVDPLASPATLRRLPYYLLGLDPAIKMKMSLRPSYLKWGFEFIRNCTSKNAEKNFQARRELAARSKEALDLIESELPANALKKSATGKLILAHSRQNFKELSKTCDHKRKLGLNITMLDRDECLHIEPALAGWSGEFTGGLYNEEDSTLDPRIFCEALQKAAETKFGVRYAFEETVEKINVNGRSEIGLDTNKDHYSFDELVVCLGAESNELLKPLGLSVPIYPMQGYSLTLPSAGPNLKRSVTDPHNKMVFANIGDSVRIAGFMDANQNEKSAEKRGAQLLQRAQALWPTIAEYTADPNLWTQFRPMTPSGVPIIGPSKIAGIYLNTGHGSLGYTMAAGSAMKIANDIGHSQSNT